MKKLNLLLIIALIFTGKLIGQEFVKQERLDSVSILFKFGSSTIENQNAIINRLNKIQIDPNTFVKINAYTDSVGTVIYNNKLASKRLFNASQIVNKSNLKYLMIDSLNLNEKRNNTTVNDSLYRRVDIIVYKTSNNYQKNTPISLKINFEGGTDVLLKSSHESLVQLKLALEMDPSLKIKLQGHVCCSPDQILSLKRAQKVKEYLVKQKIDPSRIFCEGFSNTKNLVPNNSEENYSINRRVEVVFY